MTKWNLSQDCKVGSMDENTGDVIHHIHRTKDDTTQSSQ